jgi:hypothetical protein
MPETCWLSPRLTVSRPISAPATTPISMAASTPSQRLPVKNAVEKPAMAASIIMPSMPRFRTPARSAKSSPSVPKTSGVAIRITAAKKPT